MACQSVESVESASVTNSQSAASHGSFTTLDSATGRVTSPRSWTLGDHAGTTGSQLGCTASRDTMAERISGTEALQLPESCTACPLLDCQESSDATALKCDDCEEMFYSESDAYDHSYPDDAFVGGHTWIQVASKNCHPGLHVIRWGGPKNESYLLQGEHAVTVDKNRVVYMSTKGRVVLESWEHFIGSDPVYLQSYSSATRLPRDEVAVRAKAAVGKVGYHAFTMNSEHFATWACLGSKRSKELWGISAIAGTVSFTTQAAVFTLAGPLAFLALHGALDVAKVAAASIFAQDVVTRQWDSVASMFGNPKCCTCGQDGRLTKWNDSLYADFDAEGLARDSQSNGRDTEHAPEDTVSEPEMCSRHSGKRRCALRSHSASSEDSVRIPEAAEKTTNVRLSTNVYSICSAGHTACLNCLQRCQSKPLLCVREDCFEAFDGPPAAVFVP